MLIIKILVIALLFFPSAIFSQEKNEKLFVLIELEYEFSGNRSQLFLGAVDTILLSRDRILKCEKDVYGTNFSVSFRKHSDNAVKFIYQKENDASFSRFEGALMLSSDLSPRTSFLATGGDMQKKLASATSKLEKKFFKSKGRSLG